MDRRRAIRRRRAAVGGGGAPTYQYWRAFGTVAGTWSGGALAEMQFLNGSGVDITGSGTAIGGSEAFGGTAAAAFDDNPNTEYIGAADAVVAGTSWVGYNFGAPVAPPQYTIQARDITNDARQMWVEWELQGSDDGVVWVKVQDQDDGGVQFAASEVRTYDIGA